MQSFFVYQIYVYDAAFSYHTQFSMCMEMSRKGLKFNFLGGELFLYWFALKQQTSNSLSN